MKKIKSELDIQIIGSDISLRAIETSSNNMDFANIQLFAEQGILNVHERQVIKSPLIYSQHWPKNQSLDDQIEPINYAGSTRKSFMSLYHGDFEKIGHELAVKTNGFEDFTLVMNVPYG